MSIYLDEKNPGKHKPFDDAAPDIVEYVRYLEVDVYKRQAPGPAPSVGGAICTIAFLLHLTLVYVVIEIGRAHV